MVESTDGMRLLAVALWVGLLLLGLDIAHAPPRRDSDWLIRLGWSRVRARLCSMWASVRTRCVG